MLNSNSLKTRLCFFFINSAFGIKMDQHFREKIDTCITKLDGVAQLVAEICRLSGNLATEIITQPPGFALFHSDIL